VRGKAVSSTTADARSRSDLVSTHDPQRNCFGLGRRSAPTRIATGRSRFHDGDDLLALRVTRSDIPFKAARTLFVLLLQVIARA